MEAMCDWCGQVVPIGMDGTCFLGHPVSAPPVPTAAAAEPVELDVASLPPAAIDAVAPVPDFTTVGPSLPAPPPQADLGPVPPLLPPLPPVPTGAPTAPQPPHAPLLPPPVPVPPVPVAPTPLPEPVGVFAPAGAVNAQNPVDAAFAPLINATVPHDPTTMQPVQPIGAAMPPQAPTGPGWQAVHIADDVAVFEYRPPGPVSAPADVITQLTPPVVQPPAPQHPHVAAPPSAAPSDAGADVAAFAPGDELDMPESGSKVRMIVMLAILALVALGAAVAFAFGLI